MSTHPVELKGRVMSFTVLHVYDTDISAIRQALADKVAQAPAFFQHAPVVIQPHQENWPPTFLVQLLEVLNQLSFVPIGIQTEQAAIQEQARFLGLAVFPKKAGQGAVPDNDRPIVAADAKPEAAPVSSRPRTAPAMMVSHTVRSGQQIYAQGQDLIVLGTVNPGGEVYADGHIHIYGRLRGKAFAGARGDRNARIFVRNLMAEMVCIAGLYQLSDDIPPAFRKRGCIIALQDEVLHYAPME